MHVESDQTERIVIAIWADVLQMSEGIEAESHFFELGGDSLAMMMVLFRIGEEFGIEPSPLALLEAPTPRGLAALLDAARAQSVSLAASADTSQPADSEASVL